MVARDWLTAEGEAGLLPESRPDVTRREFELVAAFSGVPALDPWLVVPSPGPRAELIGLAGDRLYRVVPLAADVATFSTTYAKCEDVRLTITESIAARGVMAGPEMNFADAIVTRVWIFAASNWGEVFVRAERLWPDDDWPKVGKACQRLVEAAGFVPKEPQPGA